MVAVIVAPLPRAPSVDENHLIVMESPSGSIADAEKVMVAPKRPVPGS